MTLATRKDLTDPRIQHGREITSHSCSASSVSASIHRSPMWSWRGPARHCVRPRGGPVGQWMCRDAASGMTYACTYIYVTIGSDITVGRIVRDAHAI